MAIMYESGSIEGLELRELTIDDIYRTLPLKFGRFICS